MKSNRFRDEWDEIPNEGFLPSEVRLRMWSKIRKSTTDKYKNYYKWAAAACAVIALSITGHQFLSSPDTAANKIASVRTFKKDVRILCLPDGTRVWLNEDTEIEYPSHFSKNERTITLKGEAFFEVKRDTSRPFIITSGPVKTTVLGTSFNIKAYGDKQSEVNVRTGKVKVEGAHNTVFLLRGDQAVYSPETFTVNKNKTKILEPDWKKVLIYVDGLTLEEVIAKLKKEHSFSVNYLEDDLKNLKIQGTLDTRQGFYEMLQTIAFALEIKIRPTGNNTYLISR